jgi:hypothetical protein
MLRTFPLIAVLFVAPAVLSQGDQKKTEPSWKPLFDGKSLENWKSANFGGEGDVTVEDGAIVMDRGSNMTGVTYDKNDFPKTNYEVTLEGKRLSGIDFFCTTTFPVGDDHCSLVVGGWAGAVVGLSSIDGKDASENKTRKNMGFDNNKWYRVRIRVTPERIAAWIDKENVVDLPIKGRKISIRPECDLSRPFGICTWSSVGAVRDIKVRTLSEAERDR